MRIVFIGTVEFSLHMLIALCESKAEILGVITSEDNRLNSDYADLVPFCKQNDIPFLLTNDVNEAKVVKWIKRHQPDAIFCFGWSRLIKQPVLQLPPLGVVGYHPSELPKNRGRHPLIWALVLGLKETASTFFFIDEGIDSGDILSQQYIKISVQDDARSLYTKMIETARAQLLELVVEMKNGESQPIRQDHSQASFWRKRSKKDGEIDWRMNAKSIYNLVRGLTHPYVGAHLFYEGKEYKVWKSSIESYPETGNIEPGKVIDVMANNSVVVKCADGCIKLLETEPKIELNIGDYL